MIELRWFPALGVVAAGTIGCIFASGKLPSVGIVVASGALCGSGMEIDTLQAGFKRRWTMAVPAGDASVSPEQRKRRFRMVKPVELLPRFSCVAGFAARRSAVRTFRLHPLAELTFVRIDVAAGAGSIFKLVFHGDR